MRLNTWISGENNKNSPPWITYPVNERSNSIDMTLSASTRGSMKVERGGASWSPIVNRLQNLWSNLNSACFYPFQCLASFISFFFNHVGVELVCYRRGFLFFFVLWSLFVLFFCGDWRGTTGRYTRRPRKRSILFNSQRVGSKPFMTRMIILFQHGHTVWAKNASDPGRKTNIFQSQT